MQDLNCTICKNDFDLQTRMPRLLPNCGHSFCSLCIQEMIKQEEHSFSCPEDGVECQNYNKDIGIGCFPLNFTIYRILRKQQNQAKTVKKEPRKEEPVKEDTAERRCGEHDKEIELVCLTDKKLLCTDCVLFGVHKNHDYAKLEDFKKEARERLKSFEAKSKELGDERFLVNGEGEVSRLRERVSEKRAAVLQTMRENIDRMREEVDLYEKRLESQVDSNFSEIYNEVDQLMDKAKKLSLKNRDLNEKVTGLMSEVKTNNSDYQILLKSLFAQRTIFDDLKEIEAESKELESTTVAKIDRDLENNTVVCDTDMVIKVLLSSIQVRLQQEEIETKVLSPVQQDILESKVFSPLNKNLLHTDIRIKEQGLLLSSNTKKSENELIKSPLKHSLIISHFDDQNCDSIIDTKVEEVDLPPIFIDNDDDKSLNNSLHSSFYQRESSNNPPQRHHRMKKNHSFFKRDPSNNIFNTLNSNIYSKCDYVKTSNVNNFSFNFGNSIIQTEKTPNAHISHTIYSKQPLGDIYEHNTMHKRKLTIGKMPSLNERQILKKENDIKKAVARRTTLNPNQRPTLRMNTAKEINLSNKRLNDDNVQKIYQELIRNNKCKILNLSYNNITEQGLEKVLKIVINHPTLEAINADGNNIGESIFPKLKKWTNKLKKISFCSFKDCARISKKQKVMGMVRGLRKAGVNIRL